MGLNEYQDRAMSTCMDSCNNFSYMMLNLVGEVGELASKVAKRIRKGHAAIGMDGMGNPSANHLSYVQQNISVANAKKSDEELQLEAGDILWQLSGLCKVMGWDLDNIGQKNLNKLAARKAAGTIDGSGDGINRPKE